MNLLGRWFDDKKAVSYAANGTLAVDGEIKVGSSGVACSSMVKQAAGFHWRWTRTKIENTAGADDGKAWNMTNENAVYFGASHKNGAVWIVKVILFRGCGTAADTGNLYDRYEAIAEMAGLAKTGKWKWGEKHGDNKYNYWLYSIAKKEYNYARH